MFSKKIELWKNAVSKFSQNETNSELLDTICMLNLRKMPRRCSGHLPSIFLHCPGGYFQPRVCRFWERLCFHNFKWSQNLRSRHLVLSRIKSTLKKTNNIRTQHCKTIMAQKMKFSIKNSIKKVNVTKWAEKYGFGNIYWRNPKWKLHFLCSDSQISSINPLIYSQGSLNSLCFLDEIKLFYLLGSFFMVFRSFKLSKYRFC